MNTEIEKLAREAADAEQAANETRDRWSALWLAIDVRSRAHNTLADAQRACRSFAAALGIHALPIATEALAAARMAAENDAHERLKQAKLRLLAATLTRKPERTR